MARYLISYDLIEEKDYERISKAITLISDGSVRPLKSVWIIGHEGSAEDIRGALNSYLDADDKLLVAELTKDVAWTSSLDPDHKGWLENYL